MCAHAMHACMCHEGVHICLVSKCAPVVVGPLDQSVAPSVCAPSSSRPPLPVVCSSQTEHTALSAEQNGTWVVCTYATFLASLYILSVHLYSSHYCVIHTYSNNYTNNIRQYRRFQYNYITLNCVYVCPHTLTCTV